MIATTIIISSKVKPADLVFIIISPMLKRTGNLHHLRPFVKGYEAFHVPVVSISAIDADCGTTVHAKSPYVWSDSCAGAVPIPDYRISV
jgi:hypothetical protein